VPEVGDGSFPLPGMRSLNIGKEVDVCGIYA
jgi:hypothetical protein